MIRCYFLIPLRFQMLILRLFGKGWQPRHDHNGKCYAYIKNDQ